MEYIMSLVAVLFGLWAAWIALSMHNKAIKSKESQDDLPIKIAVFGGLLIGAGLLKTLTLFMG
jgi:hypothetical protein